MEDQEIIESPRLPLGEHLRGLPGEGLEDEIVVLEAEIEDYMDEVSEIVSAKEALDDALEDIGSQLEELAAETEDLRAQLRGKTTQIWMALGVAAIAGVAVIVVLLRNRSG